MPAPLSGPLAGVRILDLTTVLAGPFATAALADLGADVVKVEPPGGDFVRRQGPFAADDEVRAYGGYFQSVNRNKRGIVLDLGSAEGRAALIELVGDADALVENFRHGVMDRLGLSYEVLHEVNPRLVYAAVRGFGDARTGRSPLQDWPAYDITAQAMSGFMAITGAADGPPTKAGPGVGDIVPGLFMAVGLLAGLHRARTTGEGDFVDVGMYDALLALCERTVYQYSYTGEVPERQGNRHPLLSPFEVLPADDGWVTIAAPTDRQWCRLIALIGRVDLADDPRLATAEARVGHPGLVHEVLREWTVERTRAEILGVLGGEVPVGAVNTVADVFADPHVHARGMLTPVEQPGYHRAVTIAGSPIRFAGAPPVPPRRAPLLGEHTAEVLSERRPPQGSR